MKCKLKIYDPTLSYYLGKDSFESHKDFKNTFENKLVEGTFPLGNKIVPVNKTETGYEIEGQTFDNINSLIQLNLSGLIDTNEPELQFARLLETYNLYLDKYKQDYIDNKSKEQDEDFLKSLMDFYESFPVSDEFRETGIYQGYLSKTQEVKDLLSGIDEDLKVTDQLPTNESELWNPREEPYYIYTLTKLYKTSDKPVLESEDNLSVLRAKVIDEVSKLEGREFFVRLEPDSALNMQTAEPDSTWKWGVVAVLYERVGNEYKRVYVQNDKGEITTDVKKAGSFGANQSKNLTFTIPKFTGKEAYSKINLDARMALIEARDNAEKEPSPYYPLKGFNQEYPKSKAGITVDEFAQDTSVRLRIADEKNKIFYAGNLFVEFANGEKAPLNRMPLNEQWQKLVLNLINFEHEPANVERVVNFLNTLLNYQGGDVRFINRNGKIIVYRYAKKVEGKWLRVSEEVPKNEIPDLLEYARIGVRKNLLEQEDITEVPYIQDNQLKFKNFDKNDWIKFYKQHHTTIARQVQVGDKKWFGPIKSLLFNVESPITQLINEQEIQIQNPRLGDIEIEPDQEIDVLTILDNIESLVNQTSGSTRDILQILGILSQEARQSFEGKKIVFRTGMPVMFKGQVENNLITINYDLIPDINHVGDVLAHELVHVVTRQWLQNNPLDPLTQRLEGLLDLVTGIPEYNRNIYELLASLSNPTVAEHLKTIKIKDKSLLEEIIDVVKDILTKVFGLENVQRNDKNLYDELVTKLVTIGMKPVVRQIPEVLKSAELSPSGLKKRDVSNLPLGYDQASLDSFQEQMGLEKDDKTFLDAVVESIDADLAQYVHNKGLLSDFIAGRLSFNTAFTYLYNQYWEEDKLLQNKTPQQQKFFNALKINDGEFIEEYWIENTGFAKVKKDKVPKEKEEEPTQEDLDVKEVRDEEVKLPDEEDNESMEQKEVKDMIVDGGNEDKISDRERGAETSSIDAADKLSIAFIKMIPAIERNSDGTTKIYTRTETTDSEGNIVYQFLNSESEVENTKSEHFVSTPYGFIKYQTNQLGRIQGSDYFDTWNTIANKLEGCLSLEEMFERIDNTPELLDLIPEIFVFKDRLSQPIINPFQAEVKAKLETAFKRIRVNVFILLKDKNNTYSLINESNDFMPTAKRQINTKFLDNLKELDKYYDKDKGEFKIKEFLDTFNFKKDDRTLDLDKIEKNMTVLPKLGFEFHDKTITGQDGFKTNEYLDFKKNLVKFLNEFNTIPISIAEFVTKDQKVETKTVKGLNNFFKRVYELENENAPLSVSLMVKNAEGEKQSSLSTFNTLLQTKVHYNNAKTESELNELVPRTKNSLFKYSLTRKILFKNGQRTSRYIQLENLNGFKIEQEGSSSKGALLIDLENADWIMTNFISMLKGGLVENTRAETASTTYAFKLNDWNSNLAENRKTPFSINEVRGIFREGKIGFETQESPVFIQWLDYLRGEIERVSLNGKPFGLFSDIFTKQEQDLLLSTGVEANIPMIQKAFGDFFTNQYKEYSDLFREAGGFEGILPTHQTKNPEGKFDRDLFNTIYPNGQDFSKDYLAFYTLNLLTLHVEETILFQGDISESPKYFKRAKGVQSTGTPLSKSPELTGYLQEELNKNSFGQLLGTPLQVGKDFKSSTIKDDEKESAYFKSNQFQEGYVESKKAYNEAVGISQTDEEIQQELSLLDPYKKNNIGDGDAFVSPDFYFYLLSKVGSINQDQIVGYKALVIEFKMNIDKYLSKEQVQELKNNGIDFTITEKERETYKEGMKLIEKGKTIFPKLKCIYRGNGFQEGVEEVVQKEMMDKFALTPLFPQFTKGKPVATELLMQMLKGGYGYVKFESGTKIGSFGAVDLINQIESGNLNVSIEDSGHLLQEEFLREQIKTPEKVKEENTFGSQFRKLILSSIYSLEGKPLKLDNESTAGELVEKWEQLNQEFSQLTKIDVLGRFGITEVDGQWDYSNIDYVKVADILLEESERRDLPENLKVYFDKYKQGKLKGLELSNFYKYFESSFGNQQIQSLLASIIKKIAVQKLSGAQLVQISQSIFDRQLANKSGKTRELGFYHFKDGKVQAAECKVSMIGSFKNLFNLPEVKEKITKEMSILEKTDILNDLLLDDNFVEKYKDQLTIIGYRIPTQGLNSMEVMVIREFLPAFYGPAIVCPPEITTQSGTDYDYDKLSIIFPSLDKEGNLSTKGKKGIQNQMIQTSRDILLDKLNYHKLITPNTNSLVFGLLDEIFDQLGVSTKDAKGTKIITPYTNFQKFKAVKGKGLLGIAAVWNPSYTLMQRHGWTLNKAYLKEIGFGDQKQDLNMNVNPILNPQDKIKIYNPLTKDGIAKQEIISQLINVTVDMPSDDKFGHSIFNKSDMGALIYTTSVLGYSLRDAFYFFHQPIVYRYKALYNANVRAGLKNYQAKISAIYELMEIELPLKGNDINWTKAESDLYTDILPKNERELDPSKIYSLVPINEINSTKLDQQQFAVLAHYMLILDQAEQVRMVQSALNFDTSPDNNIQKVFKRQENYQKARHANIISKEHINQIYTNSVTSGLNISRILKDITTELFPVLYSEINQNMFKEESLDYRDTEKAFRFLSNDFLLSILQSFGQYNGKSVYDIALEFLQGNKKLELISQAEEIQKKLNKEGLSYRLLDILVINISKERADKVFNQQIFLGFENSPADKDRITREFRQLLKRPDTREFAENLAIVGMIQSGYSKSPIYFSDLIPEEFITPILSQAFDQYSLLSDKQKQKFRANFVTEFKTLRGRSLGKKDVKIKGKEKHYPKEDYRLMNYKFNVGSTEFEEVQVVEDLGLDEGFTPYEEVNDTLGLPSGQVQESIQLNFTKGKKGIGKEISSYGDNLEFALTNPTVTSPTGSKWSRQWTEGQTKWRDYMSKGIEFEGKTYLDVEQAYQQNKNKYPVGEARDNFMQSLIETKLRTYPRLVEGIDAKGGLEYLTDSTHQPTKKNSHWETGGDNAFIELLTKAYVKIKGLSASPVKTGQQSLFGYDEQSKICINF